MLTEHDIATTGQVVGLSSGEASRRLASSGPNTLPDRPMPAWRRLAKRFWDAGRHGHPDAAPR